MALDDKTNSTPIFQDLGADDDGPAEIESLCMNCHEQGVTRLLLTRIPFFKDVIVMSFSCDQCGLSNNEIQSGGKIQDKGLSCTLKVCEEKDMNRQVILSEYASVTIPELQFEIPGKKGSLTTVEGIFDRVITGLRQEQPTRKALDPDLAGKLENIIQKLKVLKSGRKPFDLVVDDPSGNSFIQNYLSPKTDEMLQLVHYDRTLEQNKFCGLASDDATEEPPPQLEDITKDEVLGFRDNCPKCSSPCDTRMKMVEIPNFKEAVIMATSCDTCGFHDNEVKGGAGIEPKGIKMTLKVTDLIDLSRDVLKSETSGLCIPELDLELTHGSLGGKFTTVEGLLSNIREQLLETNPFVMGDSADTRQHTKLKEVCDNLSQMQDGSTLGYHFILDDPAGNSYLQDIYAPDPDPNLTVEKYERTFEQNEELGLNDMQTENYEAGN